MSNDLQVDAALWNWRASSPAPVYLRPLGGFSEGGEGFECVRACVAFPYSCVSSFLICSSVSFSFFVRRKVRFLFFFLLSSAASSSPSVVVTTTLPLLDEHFREKDLPGTHVQRALVRVPLSFFCFALSRELDCPLLLTTRLPRKKKG